MEEKNPGKKTPVDPAEVTSALERMVADRLRPPSAQQEPAQPSTSGTVPERARPASAGPVPEPQPSTSRTVPEEPRPSTSASTGSKSISQRLSETFNSVKSLFGSSGKIKEPKAKPAPKKERQRRKVGELYVQAGPMPITSSESSGSASGSCTSGVERVKSYFRKPPPESESSSLPDSSLRSSIPSEPLPKFSDESSAENSAAQVANSSGSMSPPVSPSAEVTITMGSDVPMVSINMHPHGEVPDINPSRALVVSKSLRPKEPAPQAGQLTVPGTSGAADEDASELTTTSEVPPRVFKVQCPTPQPPVVYHWSDWIHTIAVYWVYLIGVASAPVTLLTFTMDEYYIVTEPATACATVGLNFMCFGCLIVLFCSTSLVFLALIALLGISSLKLYFLYCLLTKRNHIVIVMTILIQCGAVVRIVTKYVCEAQDVFPGFRKYWYDLRHHEIIPPRQRRRRREATGTADEAGQAEQAQQAEDPNLIRPGSEDTQASSRDASSIPASRATNRGDSRLDNFEEIALHAEIAAIPEEPAESEEPRQIDTAV